MNMKTKNNVQLGQLVYKSSGSWTVVHSGPRTILYYFNFQIKDKSIYVGLPKCKLFLVKFCIILFFDL